MLSEGEEAFSIVRVSLNCVNPMNHVVLPSDSILGSRSPTDLPLTSSPAIYSWFSTMDSEVHALKYQ